MLSATSARLPSRMVAGAGSGRFGPVAPSLFVWRCSACAASGALGGRGAHQQILLRLPRVFQVIKADPLHEVLILAAINHAVPHDLLHLELNLRSNRRSTRKQKQKRSVQTRAASEAHTGRAEHPLTLERARWNGERNLGAAGRRAGHDLHARPLQQQQQKEQRRASASNFEIVAVLRATIKQSRRW